MEWYEYALGRGLTDVIDARRRRKRAMRLAALQAIDPAVLELPPSRVEVGTVNVLRWAWSASYRRNARIGKEQRRLDRLEARRVVRVERAERRSAFGREVVAFIKRAVVLTLAALGVVFLLFVLAVTVFHVCRR